MSNIVCPKCKESFKLDGSVYSDIIKQVRDDEFNKELNERQAQAAKELDLAVDVAKMAVKNEFLEQVSHLKNELATKDSALKLEVERKNSAINELNSKMQLHIKNTVAEIEKERDNLKSALELKDTEKLLNEKTLKESYELQLRQEREKTEYYRDLKAKQSTKLMGESLEQHCQNMFNMFRVTAFKNAYFEKDNEAKEGTKGDFIFREKDENGNELLSIMFEMKTENDATEQKRTNESHFAKLDKDRIKKGCEYAVLVSLLELDNDFYNSGIADVSYRFDKMFVVRPNSFIAIISILRNQALNLVESRAELVRVKEQNIDITNFENALIDFREDFGNNVRIAGGKFNEAIKKLEKQRDDIQGIIELLNGTTRQLSIANKKVEDVTIKKLTKNNPTMRAMFEDNKLK
ncbi:MAG: DUF2130 domain-containing protein [Firmicutes bacterium]|nr:DUF2130 domain-containing protein [Bacillota bacterium]